jgi:HlyD family secretion protein
VEVETGIQDDTYIEIADGLQKDMEIVSGPYSVVTRELKEGDFFRRKENGKKDRPDDSE